MAFQVAPAMGRKVANIGDPQKICQNENMECWPSFHSKLEKVYDPPFSFKNCNIAINFIYSPFVILMIRAAYKSRELPHDSHDVTLVNEDGLQFQRRTRLFLQH